MGRGNFAGAGHSIVKHRDTMQKRAKTAGPVEMPFGLWTQVGRRKHKFNCVRHMASMCPHGSAPWLTIRLNRPCAAVMWPYVKLLLTTWFFLAHQHKTAGRKIKLSKIEVGLCLSLLLLASLFV